MRQFVLTLCILSIFLVIMVQAESTLDKRQARKRKRKTCKDLVCSSDRICLQMALGPSCAVRSGYSCAAVHDLCEGGYYCPGSGRCSGSGRQQENESCANGESCENGLYCDLGAGKCLKMGESSFYCYGDTDCKGKCSSLKGCYCSSGSCVGK